MSICMYMDAHACIRVCARTHDANACAQNVCTAYTHVHRIHLSVLISLYFNETTPYPSGGPGAASGMKNQNFNFVIQMSWADRTSFRMSLNLPNIQIATRSTNFCPDHFEPEHGQIGRTTYIDLRPISGRAYNYNCMRT